MFNSEKMGSMVIKIVGGLAILLTGILFFMITSERDTVHWVGLGFLIVSEAMFFFGVPLIVKKKPRYNVTLLKSGATVILAIYLGLTLILALLSGLLVNAFIVYMVLQLTFFFVAIILTLTLYALSHKVNNDIEKLLVEREEYGERDWEDRRGKF